MEFPDWEIMILFRNGWKVFYEGEAFNFRFCPFSFYFRRCAGPPICSLLHREMSLTILNFNLTFHFIRREELDEWERGQNEDEIPE